MRILNLDIFEYRYFQESLKLILLFLIESLDSLLKKSINLFLIIGFLKNGCRLPNISIISSILPLVTDT